MDKFVKYISAIDGTRSWSDIKPLFNDLFHPSCVFVTADGELNREQWAEMAKGLVSKRATASDFEVTGKDDDSFYYKLTVTVEGNSMLLTARGTTKDGQVIRVEPVDPGSYSDLVEKSR